MADEPVKKHVPIDVIAREAKAYGVDLDPRSFLAGFVIGREPSSVLNDPEQLAKACQRYFGAGRNRKKDSPDEA